MGDQLFVTIKRRWSEYCNLAEIKSIADQDKFEYYGIRILHDEEYCDLETAPTVGDEAETDYLTVKGM